MLCTCTVFETQFEVDAMPARGWTHVHKHEQYVSRLSGLKPMDTLSSDCRRGSMRAHLLDRPRQDDSHTSRHWGCTSRPTRVLSSSHLCSHVIVSIVVDVTNLVSVPHCGATGSRWLQVNPRPHPLSNPHAAAKPVPLPAVWALSNRSSSRPLLPTPCSQTVSED